MEIINILKKYYLLLVGVLIGIGLSLSFFLLFADKTNSIRILAALINGLVLILIAGYFNRSENSTVSLKDFFISDLSEFKISYLKFLENIESGTLNKMQVKSENKKLSMLAQQLLHILNREFGIESQLMSPIKDILNIISGYDTSLTEDRRDYFDFLEEEAPVTLSRQQEYLLASRRKDLSLLLKNLAIYINKA